MLNEKFIVRFAIIQHLKFNIIYSVRKLSTGLADAALNV